MIDDQQWQQQQDEQRIARERAQQLESERIERLEQERIEREQLQEDERQYREERVQHRREAPSSHLNEGAERNVGGPLSLLVGMFGRLRHCPPEGHSGLQEPVGTISEALSSAPTAPAPLEAEPVVQPMHIPPDAPLHAQAPQKVEVQATDAEPQLKLARNVLVAFGAALFVAFVAWTAYWQFRPQRMPSGLEGTPEEFEARTPPAAPTSVAALPDLLADAVSAKPSQITDASTDQAAAPTNPTTQQILPQEPSADTSVRSSTPEPEPGLPAPQAQALSQVSLGEPVSAAALEPLPMTARPAEAPHPTQQRVSQLEKEVEQLKLLLSQRPQASAVPPATEAAANPVVPVQSVSANPTSSKSYKARRPARRVQQASVQAPMETAPPAPQYNGRLLSVDMWDGKPSVVVSTGDPGDKRVRVLQPGETYNGITLREASVQNRNASFDVGGGKLVKLGVEE